MARVLVIDDDELVRATLRRALETAGYEVIDAPNGSKGIMKFEASPADVVVTDILMPEKEGIETILELRRRNPKVKIVAISGGGRTGNMEFLAAAGKLGADTTMAKPFTPKELVAAVRALLEAKPSGR